MPVKSYEENTTAEHIKFVERQAAEAATSGFITCFCGSKIGLLAAYKCLYCDGWFCETCAEEHFGKTVAEYQEENHVAAN